jgi:hypothetical protein
VIDAARLRHLRRAYGGRSVAARITTAVQPAYDIGFRAAQIIVAALKKAMGREAGCG